jgi:protein-glucosylgalactosylhydroxylysine glucosidase
MGPDEYAWPVNDSAYTNYVTKLALEFGVEAGAALGEEVPPQWAEQAAGVHIPFSDTVPGHPEMEGGYHPENAAFHGGTTVKQADTVMLAFPLGMEMAPSVLANDLAFYTEVTDQNGPAMTWAIFAIDWMEVALQAGNPWTGNFSLAAHYFNRGYANVQLPFNVWRETPGGGAVNFITGAGGFLQQAIFGSSGMRITKSGLTFNPPPPAASGGQASMMGVRSFHYLGSTLSRQVRDASVTTLLLQAGPHPLVLVDAASGKVTPLVVGVLLTHPRTQATITTATAAASRVPDKLEK